MRHEHGRHGWHRGRFGGKDHGGRAWHHRGHPFHPHGGGFGGGRGEGKRRFFERGEFKFALLELLKTGPKHGYQLIKEMEERTGGLYSPSAGSIYPNLQLLEDMQLAGYTDADGKKLYHITEQGEAALRERSGGEESREGEGWSYRGRGGREFEHRERHEPRRGKLALRELMGEHPAVIQKLAALNQSARLQPESASTAEFRALMERLERELDGLLEPASKPAPKAGDGSDADPA
ncbi:PadR family transcriptional regulator [Paenibacillus pasadenensis]|uniref:PadR family transcriptional regulator n=1 Tax=Paenibacillus TaxID=44249 RepID=UPI00041B692F|nr:MULTISPECIES: PadR family transcriptional regulator [Paenibacillus]QGG56360.1 PadR family transcriptional regulator [Paenibacillus sp. B01]